MDSEEAVTSLLERWPPICPWCADENLLRLTVVLLRFAWYLFWADRSGGPCERRYFKTLIHMLYSRVSLHTTSNVFFFQSRENETLTRSFRSCRLNTAVRCPSSKLQSDRRTQQSESFFPFENHVSREQSLMRQYKHNICAVGSYRRG